jgi:hypothetical protein
VEVTVSRQGYLGGYRYITEDEATPDTLFFSLKRFGRVPDCAELTYRRTHWVMEEGDQREPEPERLTRFFEVSDSSMGDVVVELTEAKSGSGVAYANVVVLELHGVGGMTDERGMTVIKGIRPGLRVFKSHMIGFVSRLDTLIVSAGRVDTMRVKLERANVRIEVDR